MTPEGKVKKSINKLLDKYPHYRFMPVPTGFGKRTLDYLLCVNGKFLGIEAKRPGEEPTELQRKTIREIRANGGETFVIDGDVGLDALERWMLEQTS